MPFSTGIQSSGDVQFQKAVYFKYLLRQGSAYFFLINNGIRDLVSCMANKLNIGTREPITRVFTQHENSCNGRCPVLLRQA